MCLQFLRVLRDGVYFFQDELSGVDPRVARYKSCYGGVVSRSSSMDRDSDPRQKAYRPPRMRLRPQNKVESSDERCEITFVKHENISASCRCQNRCS